MQIATHLPAIISLIAENPTVSIVAPTGSGKSVAIPAAIAAAGSRVFVTVPTRTSAVSLATYQTIVQNQSSQQTNPGSDASKVVGYAAEAQVHYNQDTLIAYVTDGHAYHKMLSYFEGGVVQPINFCDVLMVDEIHSGSLRNTMIISLWMYAHAAGVEVPRLVIASATPVPMRIDPTPVLYTVDLAAFPITYHYLAKDIDVDDSKTLYFEAAKLGAQIHANSAIAKGHMLIFAPGKSEVESVVQHLHVLLKDSIETVSIIPAYGALKAEDIALIYAPTTQSQRKIVVATNIAEMSITIPDIGFVVDTMTEKLAETSQSGGLRLVTSYISKDSAKQRAGRSGRTLPGECYRMCTQATFDALEAHRAPEIQRVPIYEVVMQLLNAGLHPQNVVRDIDATKVTNAIRLLKQLGMVVDINGSIGVTDTGNFSTNFPLSVRNSTFIWQWLQSGLPVFPGIVTACLIDSYGPSYYWVPRRKPGMDVDEYNAVVAAHKTKYFDMYRGRNDLETALNMWNDLMATVGGIKATHKSVSLWAQKHNINNKKIRELLTVVNQSVKAVSHLGYPVEVGPFTTAGVMNAARPILAEVYSDMTVIQKRGTEYFNPVTREYYRLDSRDSINDLVSTPSPGIIALIVTEIKSQRGVMRIISFGVDTDKDGLGRPIVVRTQQPLERGREVITRKPQAPRPVFKAPTLTQHQETSIADALDLLATLNIGKAEPTQEVSQETTQGTTYEVIPLHIQPVQCGTKIFNLIQEHDLPAGTKQRGIAFFHRLKSEGFNEVVTYGTPYGYGQVATAWSCWQAGLTCTIFVEEVPGKITDLTQQAINYGAHIMLLPPGTKNSEKHDSAVSYANEGTDRKFVALGLDDPAFIQDLADGIKAAAGDIQPQRIWVAGGSAVLTRALAKVFPNAFFNIVQVGRELWPDLLVGINHKVYISTQPFPEPAQMLPPYPSLANYDAKVWRFACTSGENGDWIWNVK